MKSRLFLFSFVSVMLFTSLVQAQTQAQRDTRDEATVAIDSCDGQFEAVNDQGQVAADVKSAALQAKIDATAATARQRARGTAMIVHGDQHFAFGVQFQSQAVDAVELATTAWGNGEVFWIAGMWNNATNQFEACIDAMVLCGTCLGNAYNEYVEAEEAYQGALDFFTDIGPA